MERLNEYQGKQLLKEFGIRIPEGSLASNPGAAVEIFEKMNMPVVLKAQVLTGGRGLAGGIKFADTAEEVKAGAEELFAMEIKGLPVEEIMVEEKLAIKDEYYVSIMLDRNAKKPVMLGTTQGGMNVEKLAEGGSEMLSRVPISPLTGVQNYHGLDLFSQFDIPGDIRRSISGLVTRLYRLFQDREAFLVEINPLVITEGGEVIAADCKLMTDPAASYVKQDMSPRYIPLEGDIGILANGAGLTMMTMDVVKEYGGSPANFLEVGGEFYKRADEALNYLLDQRKDLKGLVVSLFGAYARTDVIIRQVVDVLKERGVDLPVSFRVRGTGEEEARSIVETELNKKVHLNLGDAVEELLEATGVSSNES